MLSTWSAGLITMSSRGDLDPQDRPNLRDPGVGGARAQDGETQQPPFVREAQSVLRDLGYHPGPIDGIFSPRTRSALERYQLAEKLPVTGLLDAETLQRLDVYRRLFRPARDL